MTGEEVTYLEILYSFIVGVIFLAVGIIAFFSPPKLPWLIRFIIIVIGIGFILFSLLTLFGLIPS